MRYDDIPQPLDTKGVARMLGITRQTVTTIPAEDLPFFLTPGGYRRYLPTDVRTYLESRMVRTGHVPLVQLAGQTTVEDHL